MRKETIRLVAFASITLACKKTVTTSVPNAEQAPTSPSPDSPGSGSSIAVADVTVNGEISVNDDDFVYNEPTPTTLRILLNESPNYDLYCAEPGLGGSACVIPLLPVTAKRATFSKVCPALGARTIACFLRHFGKANSSVTFQNPDETSAPILNAGAGSLSLAISRTGLALESSAAGDAVTSATALIAEAGRAKTVIQNGLTGTWVETCIPDDKTTDPCGYPAHDVYFEEYVNSTRHVRIWSSAADAKSCHVALNSSTSYSMKIGGKTLPDGLSAPGEHEAFLDGVFAALPPNVRSALRTSVADTTDFYMQTNCADTSTAACRPIASGVFSGISENERAILRARVDQFVRSLEFESAATLKSECDTPTIDDLKACRGSVDVKTNQVSAFCANVASLVSPGLLAVELDAKAVFVAASTPPSAAGFAGCNDAADRTKNHYKMFCTLFQNVRKDMGLKLDSGGRLTADAAGKVAAAGACPLASIINSGGSQADCRTQLVAKSATEQFAAFVEFLQPAQTVPALCPQLAANAPSDVAAAAAACRKEFLAEKSAVQLISVRDMNGPGDTAILCANRSFAAALIDSRRTEACLPQANDYIYSAECTSDSCASSVKCWRGTNDACVDGSHRPTTRPAGLLDDRREDLGVDGVFSLASEGRVEFAEVSADTGKDVSCEASTVAILTAKLESAGAFVAIDELRQRTLCADQPSATPGVPREIDNFTSKKRYSR